jgi:membrane protease subunit HflC
MIMDNINTKMIKFATLSLLILVVIFSTIFQLDQRQSAIIFQFGEAVRVVKEPGLHIKIPFIQKMEYFDNRIMTVDAEAKEVTASDGKRVIMDAFAKYVILDPVTFYKTVNNYQGAKIRLNKILESSMRKVIGRVDLTEILSTSRGDIMSDICNNVNEETKNFGIKVYDVRILRADLPKENSEAIYKRMQTEREKEAKQIRAEGQEEAARVSSKADKESQVIIAEAYKQAQIIKGEGDAAAAKIYNAAYSKDPDFYKFYKSLSTYKEILNKEDTSYVISPSSPLLEFMKIGK